MIRFALTTRLLLVACAGDAPDDPWAGMSVSRSTPRLAEPPALGGTVGFTPPPVLSLGLESGAAQSALTPPPLLPPEAGGAGVTPVPGPSADGSSQPAVEPFAPQYRCIKKAQIRSGVAMDSDKAGC